MTHEIKIDQQYYVRILSREKLFEIRCNDRDYQKGDEVILKEICSDTKKETGSKLQATVGFVCSYEQKIGYVVFSLLNIEVLK